jgi:hypothetical protein
MIDAGVLALDDFPYEEFRVWYSLEREALTRVYQAMESARRSGVQNG